MPMCLYILHTLLVLPVLCSLLTYVQAINVLQIFKVALVL